MTFIVDASFGHAAVTPDAMRRIGASGAILYAGCSDPTKNATAAEVHALLDAGFSVGLVIEETATALRGGYDVGLAHGRAIVAAARAMSYDVDGCVLYASGDWNTQGSDLDAVSAAMHGFASVVPVPGYYGNSYAIDRVVAQGHARFGWQSDSASFSNGASANAHLLQRYNDPRAGGLPVDVNDIARTPLGLMGDDMTPSELLSTKLAHVGNGTGTLEEVLADIFVHARQAAALKGELDALKAEVDALKAGGGQVDPAALAQAIAAHVKLAAQ